MQTPLQALIDLDDRPPFGDLTRHSRWSYQAQGYLTMLIASAADEPLIDPDRRPVAHAYISALANAIRFTMMDYCVGPALGAAAGARPTFALQLTPAPEVAHLVGRSALVYGHDEWRWVAEEVVAPLPPFAAAQFFPHDISSGGLDMVSSGWATQTDSQATPRPSARQSLGEYPSLTEALSAAIAAGYLLLAAILERVETAHGTQWRPVARA